MDIKHLKHFKIVVDENQNMSRAAKKLHISQPPLSQQIKSMEKTLGVNLFERHGRKLELADEGKALYQHSVKIVNLFEEMVNEMKGIGKDPQGDLVIAVSVFYSSIFDSSILFNKIKEFKKDYPKVKLKIAIVDGNQLRERMEAKEIDLAVLNLPVKNDEFSYIHLETQQFVCVVPELWKDTINKKRELSFKEIKDLPLILLKRDSGNGIYEKFLEACLKEGFYPDVTAESNDVNTVLSLVKAGIGATILPQSIVSGFLGENLRVIKFSDTNFYTESVLMWLKDRYMSTTTKLFLEYMKVDY